ncbi:MAG: hypothetical protein JXP73_15065 [Deltaproteobacteria bacterium]|nr:hypothetical protein [Deltaproteobacteria bacterium]
MDKDQERSFLETLAQALVSLPFDLKVLLEAVADPDLEHDVREIAAAAVVYIISPREGNVEPYLRYGEDAIMLRLAAKRVLEDGGESAGLLRQRFAEEFERMGRELATIRGALGQALLGWLDGRWSSLRKATYARKKISVFVDDQEVGTFLYDEGLKFGTDYPISEKSIAGRLKQAQPLVDHLQKKWDQDKKKITS